MTLNTLSVNTNTSIGGRLTYNLPHFEIMQGTTALTTIVTNTWIKVNFTSTTALEAIEFTHSGNNRMTYTGLIETMFHTGITITISANTNNSSVFEFALYKNGGDTPGSHIKLATNGSLDPQSSAIHKMVTLNTNDYVELWCTRLSGSANLSCDLYNMFCMGMACVC